jgi:hypothetical protein
VPQLEHVSDFDRRRLPPPASGPLRRAEWYRLEQSSCEHGVGGRARLFQGRHRHRDVLSNGRQVKAGLRGSRSSTALAL